MASQAWLWRRLHGLQPCNFGCEVFCIACARDLEPPPAFRTAWLNFAREEGNQTDIAALLSPFEALLVFSNPFEPEQVLATLRFVERVGAFGQSTPPLFWIPHTTSPELRPLLHRLQPLSEQNNQVVFHIVKVGFDGILVDEPEGMRLALQVRKDIRRCEHMSQEMDALEALRLEVAERVRALKEQIHHILWEYLPKKVARCIPPRTADVPASVRDNELGQLLAHGSFTSVFSTGEPRGGDGLGQVVTVVEKATVGGLCGVKRLSNMIQVLLEVSCESWRHPNLVRLVGIYHTDTRLVFRQNDDSTNTSLFSRLQLRQREDSQLSLERVCSAIEQVFRVVAHLHTGPGICHRDLKPENFLLAETEDSLVLKLSVFDLSTILGKRSLCKGPCGSMPFVAPEVLTCCSYDGRAADMWSLGVVLLEILCDVRVLETVLQLRGPDHYMSKRIVRSLTTPGALDAFLLTHARQEVRPLLPVGRTVAGGVLAASVPSRWKAWEAMDAVDRMRGWLTRKE